MVVVGGHRVLSRHVLMPTIADNGELSITDNRELGYSNLYPHPPVEEPHFFRPLQWNFQQHFYSIP